MLERLPISYINSYVTKTLGEGWEDYEVETVLVELGLKYSPLVADEINVIKLFRQNPNMFYEDPYFFLHACDVINGNVADFDTVPHITSLEAAYAIVEASHLLGLASVEESPKFEEPVQMLIREILINDGYSQAVWPFDSVGITGLSEGATEEDMAKKSRAIKEYIEAAKKA